MIRLSLDDLNAKLVTHGYKALDGDMLVIGGGGSGGTLYWNIGGWGIGGETVSVAGDKEAHLSLGLGGFNVERTVPIGALTLRGGILIGGGSAELQLLNRANPTLDDALDNRYETTMTNNFFVLAPTAGLRVKLTDFIFVQADAGYLATIGDWKFQDRSMSDLPNIGGPMIKVGVVFGGSTN